MRDLGSSFREYGPRRRYSGHHSKLCPMRICLSVSFLFTYLIKDRTTNRMWKIFEWCLTDWMTLDTTSLWHHYIYSIWKHWKPMRNCHFCIACHIQNGADIFLSLSLSLSLSEAHWVIKEGDSWIVLPGSSNCLKSVYYKIYQWSVPIKWNVC